MPIFSGVVGSLLISLLISATLTVAKMLLFPPKRPDTPQREVATPADGKFNEKQNVPSLTRVYGTVKKGSDYAALEEKSGVAYHVLVWAGHRIDSFVDHYLHDEKVITIDHVTVISTPQGPTTDYVTNPAHWGTAAVSIITRLGVDAETAWPQLVRDIPEAWTDAHRGDGLAQILMTTRTVNEDLYSYNYPNGMPLHTAVGNGALIYDPRDVAQDPGDVDTWVFSKNLALIRLDHLTNPSGGKLTLADMYLPDWADAADVCDEVVTNKAAASESRYIGGLWYYHSADPVEIGRTIDQAADLVVYSRTDGLIGVHGGTFVTPDIRITEVDILEFTYAANRSVASTVLAVRGRYTDPANAYNTVDAAIYGDPYTGDETQRTKTVDNPAVQSHNHMQRLQKLAFIRANAPRVSLAIPYLAESTSRLVAQRRFVTVHYPARGLDEAVVEIIGRPRLSLSTLKISFEAIVVSAALYDFDAATEEGGTPTPVDVVVGTGVPVPTGFAITIVLGVVSGGQTGAQAKASWDFVSDALSYELQYQLSDDSQPPSTVTSVAGQTEVNTPFLATGVEYKFRLRTVSNGQRSDWTSYIMDTAVADVTAPGTPTGFSVLDNDGATVTLGWTQPNSTNVNHAVLYSGPSGAGFGSSTLLQTISGGPSVTLTAYDSPVSGAYDYWVKAFNASNIGSTEVGPVSAIIL